MPNWIKNTNKGSKRFGKEYWVERKPNSAGYPGTWHHYRDGADIFIEDPAPGPHGVYADPTPIPAAPPPPPAPEPAAAPPPPPPPAPEPAAAPSTPEPNWVTNMNTSSDRYAQQYWVERKPNEAGYPGTWHHYRDGTDIFIEDPAPGPHGVYADPTPIPAAPPPPPAPEPAAAPPPPAPAPSSPANSSSAEGSVDSPGSATGTVVNTEAGLGGLDPAPNTGGAQAPDSLARSSTAGGTYTVSPGDTMWEIAHNHNMSLDELTAMNPQITNHNLIRPGQKVNVGDSKDGQANPAGQNEAGSAFPTTSTYPPQDGSSNNGPDANAAATDGWADGTGGVPADPANVAMEAPQYNQDDPFSANRKRFLSPNDGSNNS